MRRFLKVDHTLQSTTPDESKPPGAMGAAGPAKTSGIGDADEADGTIAKPVELQQDPVVEQNLLFAPTSSSKAFANQEPAQILIAGGGIVGLVMALALKKHAGLTAQVYEQAPSFDRDVGAGMGLYANGLRVLRDINPAIVEDCQKAGYPYLYRRWERHDGSSVAVAQENVLTSDKMNGGKVTYKGHSGDDLQTIGIRRWKLQHILYQAVQKAEIPIYFSKKVLTVNSLSSGLVQVVFVDGSTRETQLLIAADGGRSVVRSKLLETRSGKEESPSMEYTGVTCIMGVAENMKNCHGISLPISPTTHCHGCFYPTGETEQCFQFHFPIAAKEKKKGEPKKQSDSCWGNLSQEVSREECQKLAAILEKDGWDDKFLKPLRGVTRAVRVGFIKLLPPLKKWSFNNALGVPRIVLVGDAAHPPVPYLGQGAQQGMEDAGTLALLVKRYCSDVQGNLHLGNFDHAVEVYEHIRIPRVAQILENSYLIGDMQQRRADNAAYNVIKEE